MLLVGVLAFAGGFAIAALLFSRGGVVRDGYEDEHGFHLGRDPRTEALALGLTPGEIRHIESRREWETMG